MKRYLLCLIAVCLLGATAYPKPSLETRVYKALMAQPPAVVDTESKHERAIRMRGVARDVTRVSRKERDAAVLLALGWHESRWAQYVGAGCVEIPEGAADCDAGLARSYWQVHKWCRPGWRLRRGHAKAPREFANCAIRHWRGALARCRNKHPAGELAGGFSGYRFAPCDWSGGVERAKTYRRMLEALQ